MFCCLYYYSKTQSLLESFITFTCNCRGHRCSLIRTCIHHSQQKLPSQPLRTESWQGPRPWPKSRWWCSARCSSSLRASCNYNTRKINISEYYPNPCGQLQKALLFEYTGQGLRKDIPGYTGKSETRINWNEKNRVKQNNVWF